MKGCLQTIGTIAFIIIVIFIGYTTYNSITETKPTPTPKTSPSTPPPAPAPTPIPEIKPTTIPAEEPPAPKIKLPTVIREVSQSTELITRNYSWTYKGKWSWEGEIPSSLYEYYQNTPRPPTKNYSIYVTHPLDDFYIDLLAGKIEKAAQQEGFTGYETIEFAAAFVQSLPYTADSVTSPYDEYPRYPIETLVDNGGDCEDTSILLASLLDNMGYKVVLIMLPNHCAVGVKINENISGAYYKYEGDKYYYLETTGTRWEIGQLPEQYENTAASLRPMVPTPILTHEWEAQGKGIMAETMITVKNLGSATAHNIYVYAGFDAGGGKLWNPQESKIFTLPVNQQITVQLNLRVPLGKHTRFVIQIIRDGFAVDQSYSKWFDT